MSMIIDGTNGLTFNNATTQASAGLTAANPTITSGVLTFPDATTQTTAGLTSATGLTKASPTISSGVLTYPNGATNGGFINGATAVASTSGTSIDFTSLPSWVKRITVMYQAVSTNGTSDFWLRLGTSGGFATSGYVGYLVREAGSGNSYNSFSSAFLVSAGGALASELFSGNVVLTNQTGNVWTVTGQVTGSTNTGNFGNIAGYVSLGGTLTQLRLTSASPDTFDAGTVNILYE